MKKIILIFLSTFAIFVGACNASAQMVTNWGMNVAGVQLAVIVTNNILAAGSPTIVQCIATNTGNELMIYAGDPSLDMQMYLVGKNSTNDLSLFKNGFRPGGGPGYGIHANELQTYMIPVDIGHDVTPGTYYLKAKIKIRIQPDPTTLKFQFPYVESVPVKIEIK